MTYIRLLIGTSFASLTRNNSPYLTFVKEFEVIETAMGFSSFFGPLKHCCWCVSVVQRNTFWSAETLTNKLKPCCDLFEPNPPDSLPVYKQLLWHRQGGSNESIWTLWTGDHIKKCLEKKNADKIFGDHMKPACIHKRGVRSGIFIVSWTSEACNRLCNHLWSVIITNVYSEYKIIIIQCVFSFIMLCLKHECIMMNIILFWNLLFILHFHKFSIGSHK